MTASPTIEPLRRRVTVSATVETAFRVFTERMGDWWPVERYSVHEELADEAGMDGRLGGAIYERWREGTENWGEITVWEPPDRLVFSWHPGGDPAEATEVEVTFNAEGDGTLVQLEHRGWERLGDRAPDVRAGYADGWQGVLEQYGRVVEAGRAA
jgi:uncharacterized protein YndB with AHSA1/START domain